MNVKTRSNVVIELKVISMWGLHGAKNKKVDRRVDYGSLKVLDNELKTKTENDLLMMDFVIFVQKEIITNLLQYKLYKLY
jgi:hypothetical protein